MTRKKRLERERHLLQMIKEDADKELQKIVKELNELSGISEEDAKKMQNELISGIHEANCDDYNDVLRHYAECDVEDFTYEELLNEVLELYDGEPHEVADRVKADLEARKVLLND